MAAATHGLAFFIRILRCIRGTSSREGQARRVRTGGFTEECGCIRRAAKWTIKMAGPASMEKGSFERKARLGDLCGMV